MEAVLLSALPPSYIQSKIHQSSQHKQLSVNFT